MLQSVSCLDVWNEDGERLEVRRDMMADIEHVRQIDESWLDIRMK